MKNDDWHGPHTRFVWAFGIVVGSIFGVWAVLILWRGLIQ